MVLIGTNRQHRLAGSVTQVKVKMGRFICLRTVIVGRAHILPDPIVLVVFQNLPYPKNLPEFTSLFVQALSEPADTSHVAKSEK